MGRRSAHRLRRRAVRLSGSVDRYIGLLIVHGAHQGHGVGRHLHEAVLARVRQETTAQQIRLGIVMTNAGVAEPFWTALGYAPTGETKPYRYDKLESTVSIWERTVRR